MGILTRLFKFFTNITLLKVYYVMTDKGYLAEKGWIKSTILKRPVDSEGNPIPWVSLPFLDFLAPRLNKTINIFEFGSGNSTLYFSKRVNSVTSVESDPQWHANVSSQVGENVSLLFFEKNRQADYCTSAKNSDKRFDIIVIDGHSRYECALEVFDALNEGGVIVLDNSNRKEYKNIYDLFLKHGFRYIDFWGLAPGALRTNCTTIFYKTGNCLEI